MASFPNRQKLHDEFSRQVVGVFSQWESDVDKTKDQEEKLAVSVSLNNQCNILMSSIAYVFSTKINLALE